MREWLLCGRRAFLRHVWTRFCQPKKTSDQALGAKKKLPGVRGADWSTERFNWIAAFVPPEAQLTTWY
jgi:hypothetical protein